MKKVLLFVFWAALLTVSSVFAQDMGIQIIGGPEIVTQSVSLDDLKTGTVVEIDGWGIIKVTSFDFVDEIYKMDSSWWNNGAYESGSEADYALLRIDITNTTLTSKNYLEAVTVKAVYDDVYEYAGWSHQYDFNHSQDKVIHTKNWFSIDPMYQGHYAFGCTLPNAVVTGSKPLRLEIKIDENELTYHIRK